MANSYVIIQFNDIPQAGDSFEISALSDFVSEGVISLEYTPLQVSNFQEITDAIAYTANYLESNYNVTNTYTITSNYIDDTITIVDNTNSILFSLNENNSDNRLTIDVFNESLEQAINISSLVLVENSTDPCNLYDIEITTNVQATELTSPVNQTVSTNPFTVTGLTRNDLLTKTFTVTNGSTSDSLTNVYIPKLTTTNLELDITTNFNQKSSLNVKFNTPNIIYSGFFLEYSLDNVDFYRTSAFSGLNEGNYTLYIRDNIGCSISIPFEVTEEELNVYTRVPVFKVSSQNSLITVKRDSNPQNPLNTLSYEEENVFNRKDFKQLYQADDGILRQQYKSTYENVEITLHDCQGNENIIIPVQKTDNYNITDVRDVTPTRVNYLGQNYVAIQYISGNTYDPVTLAKDGEYFLGSLVPEFMNVGDGVVFQGFPTLRVQDIIFKDEVQVLVLDMLLRDFDAGLEDEPTKMITKYNVLDYNVFEFDIDLSTLNGNYYLTYKATDSEFDTIEEITEIFNVSEHQPRTYIIQYYNTENNETNYSTGIKNILRLPYDEPLTYSPDDEQDTYNTDTNVVSLEASLRNSYTLSTESIPQGFVKKIALALTNDRIFINTASYQKTDKIELEPIVGTNLYRMNVKITSSDEVYSNIVSDGGVVLPSGQALNIGNNGVGFLLVN